MTKLGTGLMENPFFASSVFSGLSGAWQAKAMEEMREDEFERSKPRAFWGVESPYDYEGERYPGEKQGLMQNRAPSIAQPQTGAPGFQPLMQAANTQIQPMPLNQSTPGMLPPNQQFGVPQIPLYDWEDA